MPVSAHSPHDFRPTLLLLSGLLCDEEVWTDLRESLEPLAEVRTIHFAGYSSIESMAEHVLATAPATFALAGHSMGGRVALEVVRRAPDRVIGIALLNTGVHPMNSSEPQTRGQLVELARKEGMSAVAAQWLPPMLGPARESLDPLIQRLHRMVTRSTPQSLASQMHALLNRPNALDVLGRIRVPALLLSATEDKWSPPRQHAAMLDQFPVAELEVLEDAGHMAPVEQPIAVASALIDWLERIQIVYHAPPLDDMERLKISLTCERLIHRYARLNDAGAWESLAAMFSESAVFYRPADPEKAIRGRQRILESFKARPPRLTRHVMTDIEVDVESTTRAHSISTVALYQGEPGSSPASVSTIGIGRFYDTLVRIDGHWLFARRHGSLDVRGSLTR